MLSLKFFFHIGFIAAVFAYDAGVQHNYKYETSVVIDEQCSDLTVGDRVGHRLSTHVYLTNIWKSEQNPQQKLMKIQLSEIKLLVSKKSSFEEHKSELEKISSAESFFLLNNNKVEKFWDDPGEISVIRNLKRSVGSLLQVRRKDGEEKEIDVSGICDVFYKVEGNTVRRSKGNCHHPLQNPSLSQAFGVRSMSLQHSTGIDCDLKNGASDIISKCLATEQVKTFSNLWKKPSICIQSTSQFILQDTSASKDEIYKNNDYKNVIEEIKKSKENLVEGNLLAVSKNEKQPIIANIMDSTMGFFESLKPAKLAKLKSASAFFKLLPTLRSASQEDITKVLKHKKFEAILPQILDILAASATDNSLEATLSFFDNTKGYDEKLERFLISLSVLPRVDAFVLSKIKSFLEKGKHNEKIEATLITTLGALLKTYAKHEVKADTKVVEQVLGYLEDSLKKCTNDDCILSYLRGLRNAAQPKSIPLLLNYALKGGRPALESLLAVKNMLPSQLPKESQNKLLKTFHQVGVKQDRSSRAIAAEIVLQTDPSSDIIKEVLGALSDQTDAEFSTFVVSKILRRMEEDKEFRSRILRILPAKEIAHYYSLSQKGKSSLFKRQLLGADGLNVTYGIEMELLDGGLLKRSSFDVEFVSDAEITNLLSVGMFAEGMASFAGDSTSDDGSSPSAGMELTLLGASLRPYVFFSSTSELMGHAWSGTASEPTPALQGIFSLSDDNDWVILHNGLPVRVELRGAMSTDLSASIQISIWSRNSQSLVKNAAALLVRGSAVVDADFVKSRGEYQFYGYSSIDFSTDLDFYESPFKMCLQMEQPSVVLRHDFQKSVEIAKTKVSIKKTKKRKRSIPSRSYALHHHNNELCRIMKNSD